MGDMSIMAEAQTTAQVLVAGRVRPLLATDQSNGMVCAQAVPQLQQIVLGNKCFPFPMDFAFPMEASQKQVFETAVQPLMDRLLEGYDTSVVAYGQPASGKSFTMLGPGVAFHISETEYGIIPRATRYLFSKMRQGPAKKFQVKVSFISVQNEMLRDLLASSHYQQQLMLLESDAGYPVITGLQEVECETIEVLYNVLQMGMEKRKLEWNSARESGHPAQAHSVFTLFLEQQWVSPEGTMEQRLSIARFVDLASSEKIYFRGMGGHIMGETIHVDPGLIALGTVIQSISLPTARMGLAKEVYRQSTLTRLLKESFGGRSYSLVVCCISPALLNFDESLVTLQTVDQFRQIRNHPVMNALSINIQADNLKCDLLKSNGQTNLNLEGGQTGDNFGLEFATSQWIKLVDSAEGLFSKLVKSNTLSKQERDEIEKWLCLKHECEDCVRSDDEVSVAGNDGRHLEKIDEVTETEEKSDSSKEAYYPLDDEDDELKYDSEIESETEIDSQKPDFIDKLDKYIMQFKDKTDEDVNCKQEKYVSKYEPKQENLVTDHITQHPIRSCLPNNRRRRSIHPGMQLPLLALDYNATQTNLNPVNVSADSVDPEAYKAEELDNVHDNYSTENHENVGGSRQDRMEPQKQLKQLISGTLAKRNKIKQASIEIEGAQKEIKEVEAAITDLEHYIQELKDNAPTCIIAKQKFLAKKHKLHKEYEKLRLQAAELSNTSCPSEERSRHARELEKCMSVKKRLMDIDNIITHIAGDSTEKIQKLEEKLSYHDHTKSKLIDKLQKLEASKVKLQKRLARDHEYIQELQEICHTEATKVEEHDKGENATVNNDGDINWINKEEERQVRVFSERESSQKQEEFLQKQSTLDASDAFGKNKISLEKERTQSILEVNARISHVDQVLKDKSTDLETVKNEDEKEALRLEIHNLRSTRDCLIEQHCTLDDKFQKEKTLTTHEERKLLEWDEAIEAIDATIEYKNQLICGRKGGFEAGDREKGEALLLARLQKLSEMEMRMLLYKYFQKVIDLRESGRKLEVQLAHEEATTAEQAEVIKTMRCHFQHSQHATQRKLILIQRRYQKNLHLMLQTFAEESSGGGASSGTDIVGNQKARIDKEEQTSLKAENKRLHRRVQDLEGTLQKLQGGRRINNNTHTAGHSLKARSPSPESVCPEIIPNRQLKHLKAAATAFTAKVTRQKNKLIIQQHKPHSTIHSKQPNT